MHPNSGPRRRHSDELKAKVVAACDEPGVSISGVALAHGLNANLVRKWRSGRGTQRGGMALTPTAAIQGPPALLGSTPEFIALEMPASAKAAARAAAPPMATAPVPIGTSSIQIELRRGPLHLNVRWPTAAAEDCRAWLSELSSGLLK
jgi:transposase-like protein